MANLVELTQQLVRETGNAQTECKRYEIPRSGNRVTKLLEAQVKQVDQNLEIIWHPLTKKWEVYLVKFYGGIRADDLLIHQFSLKDPPGYWVVEALKQNLAENTRHQTLNASGTAKEFIRRSSKQIMQQELNKKKKSEDVAKEMSWWAKRCFGRRTSVVMGTQPKARMPAVKKVKPVVVY